MKYVVVNNNGQYFVRFHPTQFNPFDYDYSDRLDVVIRNGRVLTYIEAVSVATLIKGKMKVYFDD